MHKPCIPHHRDTSKCTPMYIEMYPGKVVALQKARPLLSKQGLSSIGLGLGEGGAPATPPSPHLPETMLRPGCKERYNSSVFPSRNMLLLNTDDWPKMMDRHATYSVFSIEFVK